MKFKLNVVSNNKQLIWYYDNVNNDVIDDKGNIVNKRMIDPSINDKFNTDYKDLSGIDHLSIELGFNCNFRCQYCKQSEYKKIVFSSTPRAVDQFIEKLKKANLPNIKTIRFWGGEPLVYWKTLVVLIPRLEALYPNATFGLITNGALLTKQKFDFFINHHVIVQVSFDHIKDNQHNILDDSNVIQAIQYGLDSHCEMMFWNVPINESCDFKQTQQYLESKIKRSNLSINYLPLKGYCKDDLYNTDVQQILERQYFELLVNQFHNHTIHQTIVEDTNRWIRKLLAKDDITRSHGRCAYTGSGILVGLNGDVYSCNMRPVKTGTIDDLTNCRRADGVHNYVYYRYCSNCPFVQFCGGYCHTCDDERHKLICYNIQSFNRAIFRFGLSTLYGVYVKDIKYCADNTITS